MAFLFARFFLSHCHPILIANYIPFGTVKTSCILTYGNHPKVMTFRLGVSMNSIFLSTFWNSSIRKPFLIRRSEASFASIFSGSQIYWSFYLELGVSIKWEQTIGYSVNGVTHFQVTHQVGRVCYFEHVLGIQFKFITPVKMFWWPVKNV